MGKLLPYTLPVSGLIEVGPVEPEQPPRLFEQTTKYLLVSIALSGPIILSHQPKFAPSESIPAA